MADLIGPRDVIQLVSTGAVLVVHEKLGRRVSGKNEGRYDNLMRTVDHVTRRALPHDCSKNSCHVEVERYDDEDGVGTYEYHVHSYENDWEPLAMPFYRVRHARQCDDVLICGAIYTEGSKL